MVHGVVGGRGRRFPPLLVSSAHVMLGQDGVLAEVNGLGLTTELHATSDHSNFLKQAEKNIQIKRHSLHIEMNNFKRKKLNCAGY